MEFDANDVVYDLAEDGCSRIEFDWTRQDITYLVKAYWVGKIIRIDIAEKKEEE